MDGAVGADRERLAEGVGRAGRGHHDRDHLSLAGALLDPERLLERVGVERVERGGAAAVQPEGARVDPRARGRLRHLLDTDGELHRGRILSSGLSRAQVFTDVRAEGSASLRAFQAPHRSVGPLT